MFAIFSVPIPSEAKKPRSQPPSGQDATRDLALPIRCAYATLNPRKGARYEVPFCEESSGALWLGQQHWPGGGRSVGQAFTAMGATP